MKIALNFIVNINQMRNNHESTYFNLIAKIGSAGKPKPQVFFSALLHVYCKVSNKLCGFTRVDEFAIKQLTIYTCSRSDFA